ncbi:hypothetical protein BHF71_09000 [Vulcanibacillus modesticaldus]|uniref:EamA domain-containing protein n=1 Tax=Vulcanibacillus modesticaldus TaxID=337097 RepID=A0A1D2YUW0_9BACI|nr:DMT family transporter [Vulcanibacillus modesticaldus]OEF99463.1 hypothetical protein BHF71_09000 [Vulcanibacillus modesticaldus]
MHNNKILALIAILITVILWGLSFISIKISLEVLSPMTLALLRFLISSLILMIIIKMKEPKTKLNRKDIPKMIMAGLVGLTAYYFFENNGIKLITASAAAIIIATIPIFSLVAEAIVYKSKMSTSKVISVLISLVGVYFLVGGNIKELISSGTGMGYLLMFGAVFSWIIYNILTKSLFEKYSQLAIVYYQTIYGTVFFIPFVLFETTDWTGINLTIILNVVYLGIFCSAIGYYLYVYALEYLDVALTSLYLNFIPLVTVIGSFYILNEKINFDQVLGGILIVFSVFIVTWQSATESKEAKQISCTQLTLKE